MDRKEKQAKKKRIGEQIDLSNGKYKDEEVGILFDLVSNLSEYIGKSKTITSSFEDWSSDG